MADRFVVTVNAEKAELTILDRKGTNSLTFPVHEVESLVWALRRGAWMAGNPVPLARPNVHVKGGCEK